MILLILLSDGVIKIRQKTVISFYFLFHGGGVKKTDAEYYSCNVSSIVKHLQCSWRVQDTFKTKICFTLARGTITYGLSTE
jgi:hypothetical protein